MDPPTIDNHSQLKADSKNAEQPSFRPQSTLVPQQSDSSTRLRPAHQYSDGLLEQGSPPNVQVDDSPLQPCMHRNKESLKVKLLLRRPMKQLVDQGILPPPKTPAAFAGQRVRLERARMGDLLKLKIQQRPARQELVRQHILEDTTVRVAPSLAEKQRMLKRARLADSLNDHLIHRPGPLELVRKNILHAPDAQMEQAIKDGVVEFRPTCEGHIPGPHVPNTYLCCEDESSSDQSSPADTPDHSVLQKPGESLLTYAAKAVNFVQGSGVENPPSSLGCESLNVSPMSLVDISPIHPQTPLPITAPVVGRLHILLQNTQDADEAADINSSLKPSATSAPSATSSHPCLVNTGTSSSFSISSLGAAVNNHGTTQFLQHSSSSKNRHSRKLSKAKSQPKARTIKFHEYKGPPNAQKAQQNLPQEVESAYELLLQQQQLFLQWQLEWQHKYPQIILPAVSKISSSNDATQSNVCNVASPSSFTTTTGASMSFNRTPTLNTISIAATPTSSGTQSIKPHPIAPAPCPVAVLASSGSIKVPAQATFFRYSSEAEEKLMQDDVNTLESVNNQNPSTSHLAVKLKLNDWKVSDLKAELKRRSLPVSGSKPQLVERLRQAESSLQDESVSTTTPPPQSSKEETSGKCSSVVPSSSVVKVEVEEFSNSKDPIDISETNNNTSRFETGRDCGLQGNIDRANLQFVLSPIDDSLRQINLSAPVNTNELIISGNNCSEKNRKIKVEENVIRDQQKQIQHLQLALKNSQHQLQQMKSSQPGCGQKHRVALQQHLQHKIQQQALQSQLQKLIQLHSVQQQSKIFYSSKQPKSNSLFKPDEQGCLNKGVKHDSVVTAENFDGKEVNGSSMPRNEKSQVTSESFVCEPRAQLADFKPPYLSSSIPLTFGKVISMPQETHTKDDLEKVAKRCFKSQMVDDVLEILIRNGELPASAAQEPRISVRARTSNEVSQFLSEKDDISSRGSEANAEVLLKAVVPPPPPFPPATFAVTLPTSMTFSRNLNSGTTSTLLNSPLFIPLITSLVDNSSTCKPSVFCTHSTPPNFLNSSTPEFHIAAKTAISKILFGQKKEELSKEPSDIFEISNGISNSRLAHVAIQSAEIDQNRIPGLSSSEAFQSRSPENICSRDVGDNSSLSIFPGEVGRELRLVDHMDVVADESSPSHLSVRKNIKPPKLSRMDTFVPTLIDNPKSSDSYKSEDYFLNELGILPADLDAPIAMEMDYSDWLENLLPNNSIPVPSPISHQHQSLNHAFIMAQNDTSTDLQPIHLACSSNGNVSNNIDLCGGREGCDSFFGVTGSDYYPIVSSDRNYANDNQFCVQRDPLLSSTRTLGCFSAGNLDSGSNLTNLEFGNLESSGGTLGLLQNIKQNNLAPVSPMEDTLLWDFAM